MKKVLLLLLSLTLLSGCRHDFKYSSRIYGEQYVGIDNMTSFRFSKEYFTMPFYPSKTMWGDLDINFGRLVGSSSTLKDAYKKIDDRFNNESYGTKTEVVDKKLIFENEYVYGIYTEWNYYGYNVTQNQNANIYLLKEDKCEVVNEENNDQYYIKVDDKEEMCSVLTYIYYPMINILGHKLISVPIENVEEDELNWYLDVYYCRLIGGDYDENFKIHHTTYLYRQEIKVSKEDGLVEELETIEITSFRMEQTEFDEKYLKSLNNI